MDSVSRHSSAKSRKVSDDNWLDEKDARKRKVIQDRLAQRARRHRLALSRAREKPKHSVTLPTLAPKNTRVRTIDLPDHNISNDLSSGHKPSQGVVLFKKSPASPDSLPCPAAPNTDNYYFTIPGFSLCAALNKNARMQGISCIFPLHRVTPPGTPNLPLPLHPVPLQMTTIHFPCIDCLPIPQLRHNLILLNWLIDEEDFYNDLMETPSFVVTGSQSWDPEGWVIEDGFKSKWHFLFE